ncbi:mucin-2-like [Podarcis lilfordi]|uniref:Mucin-2-like n=1 Tax=Podarcis lilfordi TaxID=74358 RepID=A0AA35LNF0_9SAUR|nr:mucin-2-like [Podarcis lilfordi]
MREDLTLDYVTGRLLEEWQRRDGKELSAASASSSDRLVRNAGSISEEKQPKQRTQATAGEKAAFAVRRCYRCGSTRHLRKQCLEEAISEGPKQRKQQKKLAKKKQTAQLVMAVVECSDERRNTWIIDSGSSRHIVVSEAFFAKKVATPRSQVALADRRKSDVESGGSVFVSCLCTHLDNVLCVPSLRSNLMSVSCLLKAGFVVLFQDSYCEIQKGGETLGRALAENGLFVLKDCVQESVLASNDTQPVCKNESFHKKCLHL